MFCLHWQFEYFEDRQCFSFYNAFDNIIICQSATIPQYTDFFAVLLFAVNVSTNTSKIEKKNLMLTKNSEKQLRFRNFKMTSDLTSKRVQQIYLSCITSLTNHHQPHSLYFNEYYIIRLWWYLEKLFELLTNKSKSWLKTYKN